jgi:hypothetical protein
MKIKIHNLLKYCAIAFACMSHVHAALIDIPVPFERFPAISCFLGKGILINTLSENVQEGAKKVCTEMLNFNQNDRRLMIGCVISISKFVLEYIENDMEHKSTDDFRSKGGIGIGISHSENIFLKVNCETHFGIANSSSWNGVSSKMLFYPSVLFKFSYFNVDIGFGSGGEMEHGSIITSSDDANGTFGFKNILSLPIRINIYFNALNIKS